MPSSTHQALLLWAARTMARDGFRVVGFDGVASQAGFWNRLSCPPVIGGIRPDALGVDASGNIALGEAKTAEDIDCEHTRQQLRVLSRLEMPEGEKPCRFYIAIPRSSAQALDHVLADLRLVGQSNIVRLHIPDILVTEGRIA